MKLPPNFWCSSRYQRSSYWQTASEKIAGILILGSSVDEKYTPEQDTLFLSFIVEVLSHQIDRLIENRD